MEEKKKITIYINLICFIKMYKKSKSNILNILVSNFRILCYYFLVTEKNGFIPNGRKRNVFSPNLFLIICFCILQFFSGSCAR